MRRSTLPVLVALLFAIAAVSACSDTATGPVAPIENLSNSEGQGFGNTPPADSAATTGATATTAAETTDGEGQGFGN
jgi:hypothetical protein